MNGMKTSSSTPRGDVWEPSRSRIEEACVTELGTSIGIDGFSDLYRFSLLHPDDYWKGVFKFLRTVWRQNHREYLDLSHGKPFPSWFVGGRLNWVDSVLQWGVDATTQNKSAIVTEKEDGSCSSISYAVLCSDVRRLAAGLRGLGLKQGDRVGLLMENGPEVVTSFLAISFIGAIAVPLFSGFTAEPIISRLSLCGARALIVTSGFQRRGRWVSMTASIDKVRAGMPDLEHVIVKTAEAEADTPYLNWRSLKAEDACDIAEEMDSNDPFMIVFTSGTTGKPKGTVHIHAGFPMRLSHDSAVHWDMRTDSTLLWPADFGWIGGHQMIVAALTRGATLVYYDGAPDYPDWSRMPRVIERHHVTHYGAPPTMIRGQAANLSRITANLSSVRTLMTAGEVIDPEHFMWFQRSFGRGICPVINYTGGTEASGALLANVLVRPIVPGAFNAVSPGVTLDVFDSEGAPAIDAIGELVLLQPFVGMTQSFWNDPERYLETYWSRYPNVWAHGDLARRTADGLFYLLGRSDDTLKIAGKRVGPAEVEDTVLGLRYVAEAAAVGLPDPLKGQQLVLFVVRSAEGGKKDEDLVVLLGETLEERMGRPFRPEKVYVVPELPKNRSRKLMRRLIRDVCMNVPLGDLTSLENPSSLDCIRHAWTQAAAPAMQAAMKRETT